MGLEASGSMMVIGGNLNFLLEPEDTEVVNQPREDFWTSPSSMSLLTAMVAVNAAAAGHLWRQEDSPMNRIIILDCLLNIMTGFTANSLDMMPWTLDNDYLCSIHLFMLSTLNSWNRLVPVCIGVFRYLLVCSAVLCIEVYCCSGLPPHLLPWPRHKQNLEDCLWVHHLPQPRLWLCGYGGSWGAHHLPALHRPRGIIQVTANS
jgi:hypothetical protein